MKLNMQKWQKRLIDKGKNTKKAFPILSYPILKSIDGFDVKDLAQNDHIHFNVLKEICRNFDMVAIATAMDLSVEAEEFGCAVRFSSEEVPSVIGPLIKKLDEAEELQIPEIGAKRTRNVIEVIKRLQTLNIEKPILGTMIGPFSLAVRLFDMTELMVSLMLEPEKVHLLLEKCTEYLRRYAHALKVAGANGLLIAEPAAGLLSPQQCLEFSSHYIKEIVKSVQDESFSVFLHNCGNTQNLVESMLETECMGFHFGNCVDLCKIIKMVPQSKLVFGNLDPVGVFRNDSVEGVYYKTQELLFKLKEYSNFVISSGCDIPYHTPIENIKAFFKAVEDFNKDLVRQGGKTDGENNKE